MTLAIVVYPGRARTIVLTAMIIASVGLPYALLRARMPVPQIFDFFIAIEGTSVSCILIGLLRSRTKLISVREMVFLIGVFAAAVLADRLWHDAARNNYTRHGRGIIAAASPRVQIIIQPMANVWLDAADGFSVTGAFITCGLASLPRPRVQSGYRQSF